MNNKELEILNNVILEIGNEVQDLSNKLAFAEELDPNFTLLEIAKIHSCLLNISSKIYILKPDLAPEHLKECDWSNYEPQ